VSNSQKKCNLPPNGQQQAIYKPKGEDGQALWLEATQTKTLNLH
jgi:hypothetical protein